MDKRNLSVLRGFDTPVTKLKHRERPFPSTDNRLYLHSFLRRTKSKQKNTTKPEKHKLINILPSAER